MQDTKLTGAPTNEIVFGGPKSPIQEVCKAFNGTGIGQTAQLTAVQLSFGLDPAKLHISPGSRATR